MSYKLRSGETAEDASWELLGDRRLVNEINVIAGTAYVRGERHGPPAKWAARPPKREK